jgi:thioredoxin reductase (NADPH)
MEGPTIRQITEKLGWFINPSRSEYDLTIYGAGPAGLSAAVSWQAAESRSVAACLGARSRQVCAENR